MKDQLQILNYTFEGEGLALGAVVVVREYNIADAIKEAEVWAKRNSVDPESLYLVSVVEGDIGVAYGWNGDY